MAKRRARTKVPQDGLNLRGFFRVNIVEDGDRIVGDSGWVRNTVVADGILNYLIQPLRGTAQAIALMALGTGTAPATNHTALQGELSHLTGASSTRNRVAITTSTAGLGSTGIDFQGQFLSNSSFVTQSVTIQNIMVINSTHSEGTIFAGNTYSSSVLNTNRTLCPIMDEEVLVPLAA